MQLLNFYSTERKRKMLEVNGVKGNILLGGAMSVLPTNKEVKLGTSASSA
jgi:hypothetical protein